MSEENYRSLPDDAPPSRIAAGKSKALAFGLALAGVFAAGFYFVVLPQFAEQSAPVANTSAATGNAQQLTELASRLAAAEAKVDALEKSIAELKAAPAGSATPANNAALDAKIAALGAQVDAISKTPANSSNLQSIALIDAFTLLHKAAKQGLPFTAELKSLVQLSANRPKTLALLTELQAFDAKRAPTLPQLQTQLADAIKTATSRQEPDASLTSNLRSLIHIRKEGHAQGDDDESMIARAEAALGEGDVAVAVKELESLSAAQMPSFEEWLNNAKRYTSQQAAIDAMQADILQPAAAAPAP